MWIVSQDGTITANADTMYGFTVTDGFIEIWHGGGQGKIHNLLGRYSSQEKALKVRDEIICAYRGIIIMKNLPEENAAEIAEYLKPNKAVYCIEGTEIEPFGNIVFQMPQDQEVIL